jgi:hypothetical protein
MVCGNPDQMQADADAGHGNAVGVAVVASKQALRIGDVFGRNTIAYFQII